MRVARMTIEIPRPVPVEELRVDVRVVRSGARAELLEGEVIAGGRPVLSARAWRLATSPADTPLLQPDAAPAALPGPQPPPGMAGAHPGGYISAMEWRFPDGATFDSRGPGEVWARQRIPLVTGEPDTPLTRVLTLADSTWAVAFEIDYQTRFMINTDLTVALHRDPVGEWLFVRAATAASPEGSGLAVGQLHDASGGCGRILQSLLIGDLY